MTHERCETCRWFAPSYTKKYEGQCHRFPPIIKLPGSQFALNPRVQHGQFCGEWKPTVKAEQAAWAAAVKEAFDDA